MPVLIAGNINVAIIEGQRLWKKLENIIFTFMFTSNYSRSNLALYHINIKKSNLLLLSYAYLGTRKIQIW